MSKKGSTSYYKKKLKKLFSLYIRQRAGNRCEASGKIKGHFRDCGGYNQCSHVHSVGAYPNLRFDPLNALCLCYRHHIHWWHKETGEAWEWFKKTYPKRHKYLEKQKNISFKPTKDELIELVKLFKSSTTKLFE